MSKLRSFHIITYLLTALMFFTSLGINMDMHFCQNNLKSISFFGEAPNCHELALNKKSCHSGTKSSCSANTADAAKKSCKKDCCNNKSQLIKYEGDLIVSQISIPDFQTFQFIIVPIVKFLFDNVTNISQNNKYQNYKPPLLNINIPVFVQSFLL